MDRMDELGRGKLRHLFRKARVSFRKSLLCGHLTQIPLLDWMLLTGRSASEVHTWKTELLPKQKSCSFMGVSFIVRRSEKFT